MSSVVIKSVDKEKLRRSVDDYAARLLSSHPEVEEVVVFGSFAKGNYSPGSDIDIFILLTRSDKSVRDRIPDFLPGAFPVSVDLFPYTKEEIASLEPSPILAEIRESRWRYRRPGGNLPANQKK